MAASPSSPAAARGWAFATARRFAESGADVAILARRADVLEEARSTLAATGARIAAIACDVATAEGVQRGYDGAMDAFGRVDIVVNNAGISQAHPFLNVDG